MRHLQTAQSQGKNFQADDFIRLVNTDASHQCDEVRPVCGACSAPQQKGKGPWPCRYSYGTATFVQGDNNIPSPSSNNAGNATTPFGPKSLFVEEPVKPEGELSLRSTQPTQSGEGLFLTFRSKRAEKKDSQATSVTKQSWMMARASRSTQPISLVKERLSPALRLLRRWTSQMEALSQGFDTPLGVLGEWTRHIPQRIGHSDAIDWALTCFLNSVTAYVNRNAENAASTDAANARAIYSIRSAIESSSSELIQSDVLIAICLLHLVEVNWKSFMHLTQ